jgi:hypothetical protein
MAKFLDTQHISSELMALIRDAKDKIILVSYSFKVNSQIQERLKTKSKIGTLSEIVIVYGRTELKRSELAWLQEIQDLKIFEKTDLHAKCYLNEEKAIVCSMNLYDYSQSNNIEMGILITKSDDKEAYEALLQEINHIKVNGTRKTIDQFISKEVKLVDQENVNEKSEQKIPVSAKLKELTNEQKLKIQILKRWRGWKSKVVKSSEFDVMTDEEITAIVTKNKLDKYSIYDILPRKKAIKHGEEIIEELENIAGYTIGVVVSLWYQNDNSSYDKVKLKLLPSGEEKWFVTTKELPFKEKLVAAKLNKDWFNDYLYLIINCLKNLLSGDLIFSVS